MAAAATYRFANWELGYGDFHMVPVLTTLRLITWQPRSVFVHCDVDHVSMAPGSILKKQLAAEAARQPELIKAMVELDGSSE